MPTVVETITSETAGTTDIYPDSEIPGLYILVDRVVGVARPYLIRYDPDLAATTDYPWTVCLDHDGVIADISSRGTHGSMRSAALCALALETEDAALDA